jgi:O-antigen biosynthesis protein
MMVTQKILFIGTVWPEPSSSAAGSRMMQLLHFFGHEGWDITFASSSMKSDFSADLISLGIHEVPILLNNSGFDDFVRKLDPSVVVFDRYMTEEQFGWRVAEACPTAIRVLDTEDLHALRSARKRIDSPDSQNTTLRFLSAPISADHLLSDPIAVREIASIFRCDAALVISAAEISILCSIFGVPNAQLCELPFFIDFSQRDKISQKPRPFAEREHFVSIGNFLHEPNYDAVLQLRNEIWPSIRKALPKAEMHVYGAYPTQKVHQLHKPSDGFFIKGRAEDAREVISKARVMLAPLRFGAGLKGKLVEAMLFGTPAVTTPIGAEGLQEPWIHRPYLSPPISGIGKATFNPLVFQENFNQEKTNGDQVIAPDNVNYGNPSDSLLFDYNVDRGDSCDFGPLFVHDNYDGFIKDAISLYKDETRWKNAVERGFDVVRNQFDAADQQTVLRDLVHRLLENRDGSRRQNFMGKMLMHHTVASSKYMSRWIEEKNRIK